MQDKENLRQGSAQNWREVGTDKIGNIYFIDISMKVSPVYVMYSFSNSVSVNALDISSWSTERSWETVEANYIADSTFGWLRKPDGSCNCYSTWTYFSSSELIEVDLCLKEHRDFISDDAAYFHDKYAAITTQEDNFRNAIVETYLADYNERANFEVPVTYAEFKDYIQLSYITLNESGPIVLGYSVDKMFEYFHDTAIHVILDDALQIQDISIPM